MHHLLDLHEVGLEFILQIAEGVLPGVLAGLDPLQDPLDLLVALLLGRGLLGLRTQLEVII